MGVHQGYTMGESVAITYSVTIYTQQIHPGILINIGQDLLLMFKRPLRPYLNQD